MNYVFIDKDKVDRECFKLIDDPRAPTPYIDSLIQEDPLIAVEHNTTKNWVDEFLEHGIDATIPPPDVYMGRGNWEEGFRPIQTPGLFVRPLNDRRITFKPFTAIWFLVKPSELGISLETREKWECSPPAGWNKEPSFHEFPTTFPDHCKLYGLANGDGLVTKIIPPTRIFQAWHVNEKIFGSDF